MPGPASDFPRPPDDRVYVEQFTESITGWAMIGAGSEWVGPPPASPLEVEICYDGVPRVRDTVSYKDGQYRFGVQVPIEAGLRTFQVILRSGAKQQVLFDGTLEGLRQREASADGPARKPVPRWLSPAMTLGRSVASGDVFRSDWWSARIRRYSDMAIKGQQKVRDRLLIRSRYSPRSVHDAYVDRTTLTPAERKALADRVAGWTYRPTISILCPVYNVEPQWLDAAVRSVREQIYPHWELCLADDASTNPATKAYLDQVCNDPRIKLARRPTNGHICHATNSAADMATGEFVALLDNDDLLAENALATVVERLQSAPTTDLIYSDEDKIDASGHRYDPQFKPDWSPELLLSYNYINHFTVIRRSLFESVGRFRPGYEGSQDHDLLLRVTEQTTRIEHLPEILYHWRSLPSSTASTAGVKKYVHTSGQRAVRDALRRRGIDANYYVPDFAEKLGLPILGLEAPGHAESVTIIIAGPADLAAATRSAIEATTAGSPPRIVTIPDSPTPAHSLTEAARQVTTDYVLFLSTGVEPTGPGWLDRMLAYARLEGVGAVGGLIRQPNGRIASAGTVLGLSDGTAPGDAFHDADPAPVTYYFYAEVARTVAAPGRGVLLTRRTDFLGLGGFDAEQFPRTLYDVDYAARLSQVGLRSVHVGGAEFRWTISDTHRADDPTEQLTFQALHGNHDRYSNPNYSSWESFTPQSEAVHHLPALPRNPIPVLFGTHNLTAFEGAPKILRDVALGLQQQGLVRGTIFAPAPGKAASAFVEAGLPVHAEDLPYSKRFIDGQWTPGEYAAAQDHLARLLQQVKPTVVLANTLGLFPLVEAAARQGIPGILAIQESYSASLMSQLFSPYAQWRCERAFLYADRIIHASRSCARLYNRLDGRKNFEVIHNGLDAAGFEAYQSAVSPEMARATLPAPGSTPYRIVTVGTVCERKAQHVLVEAAAILGQKRRDFTCYLVGAREGLPYLSYVRHLIQARGVDDIVVPVGETDKVWQFYRAADIFVCTSYVEAYSLSVMESEAFGLPIVSTPCGGLDEQVVWGRSALKFDFADARTLAEHLDRLLSDDAGRREMGRQSRAAFDLRLSSAEMIARYGLAIRRAARSNPPTKSARTLLRVASLG